MVTDSERKAIFSRLARNNIRVATVDDGEGGRVPQIEITREQTLNAVNGKRDALEIVDHLTGTTETERLRNNFSVTNGLFKLQQEGKIKLMDGKWLKGRSDV